MPDLTHTLFTTERGKEPAIRTRYESTDLLSFELTGELFRYFPNLPFHAIALRVYGDASLWWVIADANPLKPGRSWALGDVVLVPKDYREASGFSTTVQSVKRSVY